MQTLRELLFLLGEDLVLGAEPRESGIDRAMARQNMTLPVEWRVRRGLEFADLVRRNRGATLRSAAVRT